MVLFIILILGTIAFGFIKTVIAMAVIAALVMLISLIKSIFKNLFYATGQLPYIIGRIPEYIEGTIYEIRYGFKPFIKIILMSPFAIYNYTNQAWIRGICEGHSGLSLLFFIIPSLFFGYLVSAISWILIYYFLVQLHHDLSLIISSLS